jgi:hypothetical protein
MEILKQSLKHTLAAFKAQDFFWQDPLYGWPIRLADWDT